MVLEKKVQEGRLREGRKEEQRKSATDGVGEDESECGENEVGWKRRKEEEKRVRATDLWILETSVRSRLEVPEITEDPFLELLHVGDRSSESFESEDQSSDWNRKRESKSAFARSSSLSPADVLEKENG